MSVNENNPPGPTPPVNDPTAPRPVVAKPALAWALALVAGLIGGGVGLGVGEATRHRFEPEFSDMTTPEAMKVSDRGARMEMQEKLKQRAYMREGMVAFGALGATLGLGLGLAGGLAARSISRAAVARVLGLVLGGAAGVGVTYGIAPPYYQMALRHGGADAGDGEGVDLQKFDLAGNANNLMYPLMLHGLIFGAIGAAGGLAFGWGVGGARRLGAGVVGGLLGGLIGAVAFEFAASSLFALSSPPRPVPEYQEARIIAHLTVGVLIALGAAFGALSLQVAKARPRPTAPAPAPTA
jgi:hypothetical protein